MPVQLTTKALSDPPEAPISRGEGVRRLRDILVIAAMLIIITALHTWSGGHASEQYHDFFRRLYYLPILYGAFVFGVRGGLLTAIAAAVLYAPYANAGAESVFGLLIDDWLELVMYLVMGVLFGRLRDLEGKQTRRVRQVQARLEDAYRSLEERAVQLKAAQGYTQSILLSVTAGVVTVDPDMAVATLNPAAERILGISQDMLIGRPLASIFKDDGALSVDIRKILDGRSPRTLRDVKLVTASGKVVHAQASVSRMRDPGGRQLGAVVTIEDVSEVKALTDQLMRADRLAALGELTAGVAHEVRNPLGIIRASVQLMEDSECDRQRVTSAATVIKQEIDRLDRVIKALLDFGRPAEPTMRPVAVELILEDVALFSTTFAKRSHVKVVHHYAVGVPDVMADPEQLKQVFVNLISNAVQAMPGGGTLSVTTGEENGFVFVTFRDTGGGIPADVLSKVFDPFVSMRDDGTGLGLTIVHRIVDDHSGHMEVTSEPGVGTAFTVRLPAIQ